MIIALAGRRIDPVDASVQRFPLASVPDVLARLKRHFTEQDARVIVCSAACGADLLGVQAAAELGMRSRIILPFSRARFRVTSVVDRPGDWGPAFDRACQEAKACQDLHFVRARGSDHSAYVRTTHEILRHAQRLASELYPDEQAATTSRVQAVAVWDGAPRDADDLTAQFRDFAGELGIPVVEILTVRNAPV